ncbi:hypothetical protein Pmani_005756 [Petrolisthes manimaculis]|uniref:HD/PDEase domain-containing protein n=1 Tax=Petrolisthes manimaculis TaxID=1843537 RepID=A0AAE1QB36_9EUCA|nr:hypothetical protein Pmani_005756 [Petrolisthes manimaculis]
MTYHRQDLEEMESANCVSWEEMKVFNDAVHGAMPIPSLCVSVIDTPQFQRLRFLKQLGTTYFVYPSAAHNRFEHCLGVCYLAGQMVSALQKRQPELNIDDKDVLCVMLAGLCHDLGHGPYSHMWEIFVKKVNNGTSWTHEKASSMMFDHLMKENPHLEEEFEKNDLHEIDRIFIKELICGPAAKEDGGTWPYRGRPQNKAFLYEVVANKKTGVDVDKWDYILRDGHSLGIKVTFDYHRIVQFSRVIPGEGENASPQICVRDKECNNLYDMFHARRLLHRYAYQHRVVQTIDVMLIDAFVCADKYILYPGSNGEKLQLSRVHEDMAAYTHLTDEVTQRILLAEGNDPQLIKAQRILTNILTRKLYLYVGCTHHEVDTLDAEKLMKAMVENIPQNSQLTQENLSIKTVKFSYGMGDKNPMEGARFYSKKMPNQQKVIRKDEVSAMLPQSFQESFCRVLYKNTSEKVLVDSKEKKDLLDAKEERDLKDAKEALTAACKELNCRPPMVDSWPSVLTPVKTDTNMKSDVPTHSTAAKHITFAKPPV